MTCRKKLLVKCIIMIIITYLLYQTRTEKCFNNYSLNSLLICYNSTTTRLLHFISTVYKCVFTKLSTKFNLYISKLVAKSTIKSYFYCMNVYLPNYINYILCYISEKLVGKMAITCLPRKMFLYLIC